MRAEIHMWRRVMKTLEKEIVPDTQNVAIFLCYVPHVGTSKETLITFFKPTLEEEKEYEAQSVWWNQNQRYYHDVNLIANEERMIAVGLILAMMATGDA